MLVKSVAEREGNTLFEGGFGGWSISSRYFYDFVSYLWILSLSLVYSYIQIRPMSVFLPLKFNMVDDSKKYDVIRTVEILRIVTSLK